MGKVAKSAPVTLSVADLEAKVKVCLGDCT